MVDELIVRDLHANVEGKPILHGVNLSIRQGEVHALMGPNGSGKSTLAYTIAGHPHYQVTAGDILLNGESILGLAPNERAKAGLFLAFQYPTAIPGVSMANFLRQAVSAVRGYTDRAKAAVAEGGSSKSIGSELIPMREFRKELTDKMTSLHIDASFARRYLIDGFSGGEKKRAEILQMAMLEPKLCILDETDSGLDIDALKIVAEGVNSLRSADRSFVLVTHYQRLLDYIKPDVVHVLANGKVVKSGGPELALELEKRGYSWVEQAA